MFEGRVHLIGVGGVGMAAVAYLLALRGVEVSGSDAVAGPLLGWLRTAGVHVEVGHAAEHVGQAQTVVVSSAVRESNPEMAAARAAQIPVLHRSQALAALMQGHRTIAVAGAHGKTTTSAMIAVGLMQVGADPSFAIGGVVHDRSGAIGGARHGEGPFVAEADESDGSFLVYTPDIAVITNVEPDHLDHFATAEAFEAVFDEFLAKVRPGGTIIACADDPGAARVVSRVSREDVTVLTYGRHPQATVQVGEVLAVSDGWQVPVMQNGSTAILRLAVPGDHNALNAAAAWSALRVLGYTSEQAIVALGAFTGTGRRFERRGVVAGVEVVDDYAHHPTEVAAVLSTARQTTKGRVIVLFQPHLYSRTRNFASQFAQALDAADEVIVTGIYGAREDPDPAVTGELIVRAGLDPHKAQYVADRLVAAKTAVTLSAPGDTILTVGAGDVTSLVPTILAGLADQVR